MIMFNGEIDRKEEVRKAALSMISSSKKEAFILTSYFLDLLPPVRFKSSKSDVPCTIKKQMQNGHLCIVQPSPQAILVITSCAVYEL